MLLSRVGGASPVVVSYVLSLGVYRLLYAFNWIYRYHYTGTTSSCHLMSTDSIDVLLCPDHYERIVVWSGCTQLLLLLIGLAIVFYWHRRRGSR